MKFIFTTLFLSLGLAGIAQNIGIGTNTPDPTAQLDIASNTKGLLVPRMTQADRLLIASPATALLVFQTDGQRGFYYNNGTPGTPVWTYHGPVTTNWSITGNSLLATGQFGTTSNNHVDLITNNITRGRLTNLGEFFIGATNTTVVGDLMGAVSNATFPFAVNGYSSFNGSGVYGVVQSGTTQFAGVQGEYTSTTAGTFNTAGVRGVNQSNAAGTGFRTLTSTGPRAGVIGTTTVSNGQYTFGLHGAMGSTDIRCGGVIGDDFGLALGSLAYFAANLIDYSVYGFGNAFQVGVPGGRNARTTDTSTHIGLGIYGGLMGGWMKGLVYGTHVQGDRYSLYVDGKTYTNAPVTELVPVGNGSRVPAYAVSSLQPEIYARGKASLENGQRRIAFDPAFIAMLSDDPDALVITVSPNGNSRGLYIASQDAKGFVVRENENGGSNTTFSWIAIGTRREAGNITHAPELLQSDFDEKMNGVMFNDNNTIDKPQYMWWDGTKVRYDKPPAKKMIPGFRPGVRVEGEKL